MVLSPSEFEERLEQLKIPIDFKEPEMPEGAKVIDWYVDNFRCVVGDEVSLEASNVCKYVLSTGEQKTIISQIQYKS